MPKFSHLGDYNRMFRENETEEFNINATELNSKLAYGTFIVAILTLIVSIATLVVALVK